MYVHFVNQEGEEIKAYTGLGRPSWHSTLTDSELDDIMNDILNSFPTYGRRMLDGHLTYLGQLHLREFEDLLSTLLECAE